MSHCLRLFLSKSRGPTCHPPSEPSQYCIVLYCSTTCYEINWQKRLVLCHSRWIYHFLMCRKLLAGGSGIELRCVIQHIVVSVSKDNGPNVMMWSRLKGGGQSLNLCISVSSEAAFLTPGRLVIVAQLGRPIILHQPAGALWTCGPDRGGLCVL